MSFNDAKVAKVAEVLDLALDLQPVILDKMATEILASDAGRIRIMGVIDNLDIDPDIGRYIRLIIGMAWERFFKFIKSPEHQAVVKIFEAERAKNGGGWNGKRRAKKKLRKTWGSFFWRRKVRKAVKRAVKVAG